MSLSMFKNKLYNTIIAISLVVAIAVVSTYVPDMFKKVEKTAQKDSNEEVMYNEPAVKVESARKFLSLTQSAQLLDTGSSSKEQLNTLSEMNNLISDTKAAVKKEVKEVNGISTSKEIKKRASDYENEVCMNLNQIQDKVVTLSADIESNRLSKDKVNNKIDDIKKDIERMQEYDEPETFYNDDAHGIANSYDVDKIVGEELVKSNIKILSHDVVAKKSVSKNPSYLELNDEIKKMADSLSTPAEIYEYVRNNYQYKQYTGLRLGAVGTYEQRAGNDYDQAALLVALFRYKGYEAKFVIGNVDIDIEAAMNWLGVKTEKAAVDAMSMLGVPTQYGQDKDSNITKLRIEHVWVKVLVPYDSYRGAGKLQGEKIWIDVDPSFKQYEDEIEDNEVEKYINLKAEELKVRDYIDWEEYEDGDITLDSISSMFDFDGDNYDASVIKSDIEEYLNSNKIDIKQLGNAIGIRYIKEEKTGYLPSSLPYSVVKEIYDDSLLPNDSLGTITISTESALYGSAYLGTADASVTFYTADLYGQDISLEYEPATSEDKEVIDKYGDIYKTPSYLVRIVPVIVVNGETVARGKAQIPGTYTKLTLEIDEAGIDNVKVDNSLVAGGVYGVVFDYNTINDTYFSNIQGELQNCVDKLESGDITEQKAIVKILNTIGESYFSHLDLYNQLLTKPAGVQCVRCISECIVGYSPKVSSIMGIPSAITEGSLYIDVDTDTIGLVTVTEDENVTDKDKEYTRTNGAIKNYMMISGLLGSYLEGYVIEMVTEKPAASAVSVIEESRARGINIKTLSSENISELDNLEIDNSTKQEIRTALNNGKTVIVPEKEICYYQWKGTGYIVLNTDTGEAAYMISGTLCGGSSLEGIGLFAVTILITVATVFTLAAFEYFMWCGFWAMVGASAILVESFSVLQFAILIMGAVGLIYACESAVYLAEDYSEYLSNPNRENALKIFGKALETGILFFVFEYALPRVINGIQVKIEKLKEFIKKKWGSGIKIDIPETKPDIDSKPGTSPKPDITPGDDVVLPGGSIGNVSGGTGSSGSPATGGGTSVGGGATGGGSIGEAFDDFWKKIADQYGDDIAEQFKAFGDDGKNIINQYGDDAVDIVRGIPDNEVKEAIELINQYGDDAVELFKQGEEVAQIRVKLESGRNIISEADRIKIDSWDYTPSDDLYIKYKDVFDNPKYYNQETGAIIWPKNNGFANTPVDEVLQPGTRIDRYGSDYGSFASPEGIPYKMRAVAPGTDSKPYSVFEVVEPINVKSGKIAPWFDEPGGGIQYLLPDTVDELLDAGILRRIR